MCEARVIVRKCEAERTIMEEASSVVVEDGGRLVVRGILGESVEVTGTIERVDLAGSLIVIRER